MWVLLLGKKLKATVSSEKQWVIFSTHVITLTLPPLSCKHLLPFKKQPLDPSHLLYLWKCKEQPDIVMRRVPAISGLHFSIISRQGRARSASSRIFLAHPDHSSWLAQLALKQPRVTCLDTALPSVGWALPQQPLIKKMPYRLSYRPKVLEAFSYLRFLLPRWP